MEGQDTNGWGFAKIVPFNPNFGVLSGLPCDILGHLDFFA